MMVAKVTATSANVTYIFSFGRYFHYKDVNQFLLNKIQSFKTSVHSDKPTGSNAKQIYDEFWSEWCKRINY